MDKAFQFAEMAVICGTVLVLALMILLAMPKSYLRNFLVQILGWLMTAFCGVYVVSPVDAIPDFIPVIGWIDDVGAIVAGLTSGAMAMSAGSDNRRLKNN